MDIIKPGILSQKTADKFIDLVVDSSPFLKLIKFEKIDDPVGQRTLFDIARYKTRGVQRKEIATLNDVDDITLDISCKELVLTTLIRDSQLEDSKGNPEKTAKMIAKSFAMDLQYLFLNGDTKADLSDPATDKELLTKVLDGVVKLLVEAEKDVTVTGTDILVHIKTLIKDLPEEAQADPDLKILIGAGQYTQLWDSIANNSHAKALFVKDDKIYYRGKQVIEVPELSRIVVCNPQHILGVMVREVMLEKQRYPEARGTKFVLSTRVDMNLLPKYMRTVEAT